MTENCFSGLQVGFWKGRLDPQRKDFEKDLTSLALLARKDSFSELPALLLINSLI